MKKFLLNMFVLCILVALSLSIVSCSHKCEFSNEWLKDETSHWHRCSDEECTEISDKADHTFDEGEITTVATQEEAGAKTFTCTACSYKRVDPVVFTGLTEEEWNMVFDSDLFKNFSYKEVATTKGSGVSIESEVIYKFTYDNAWVKVTMAEQSQESYAPDTATAIELRDQLVDSIKEITVYSSYEYDPETKTYKSTKPIYLASIGESTQDITLTFSDGRLVEAKYSITFTQNGIEFEATSTITISDYGTVVLPRQ